MDTGLMQKEDEDDLDRNGELDKGGKIAHNPRNVPNSPALKSKMASIKDRRDMRLAATNFNSGSKLSASNNEGVGGKKVTSHQDIADILTLTRSVHEEMSTVGDQMYDQSRMAKLMYDDIRTLKQQMASVQQVIDNP